MGQDEEYDDDDDDKPWTRIGKFERILYGKMDLPELLGA